MIGTVFIMGNWHISIRGVGAHHNGKPYDAEAMAKIFAESLKAAGHNVLGAAFTYGAEQDLLEQVGPTIPLPKD